MVVYVGNFGWFLVRWCYRGMDLLYDFDEGRDLDTGGWLCVCFTGGV